MAQTKIQKVASQISFRDSNSQVSKVHQLYFVEKKSMEEVAQIFGKTIDIVYLQIMDINSKYEKITPGYTAKNNPKQEAEYLKVKDKLKKLKKSGSPLPIPVAKPKRKVVAANLVQEVKMVEDIWKGRETEIPTMNEKYISRKVLGNSKHDLEILEVAWNTQASDGGKQVLIEGPMGAGKSLSCEFFSRQKKLPYARLSLHGGSNVDDLLGKWIPNESGNPQFKWQDGILTKFARFGGVVVLDEANVCPQQIIVVLNSLTDGSRSMRLQEKDGELVKAHENFMLICTMNPVGDYEGRQTLDQTFKDRFRFKMEYGYDAKVEKELIKDEEILKLANRLRASKGREINTDVSTRTLVFYSKNKATLGEKEAFEIFLCNFDSSEREAVKEAYLITKRDLKNSKPQVLDIDSNGIPHHKPVI